MVFGDQLEAGSRLIRRKESKLLFLMVFPLPSLIFHVVFLRDKSQDHFFLIYINDMHTAVKFSTVYHFADDTNLLYHHENPKVLRKDMNSNLKLLYDWLCANRLYLNVSKSYAQLPYNPDIKKKNKKN